MSRKWRNVMTLALVELLAMTLWFSASAVVPQLTNEWSLDAGERAWMTMSVQIGFVVGALASAVLNLADRLPLRGLIGASAALGACTNAAIPVVEPDLRLTLILRFATGVALAGVYPPGMKLVASWCRKDRGLGLGIMVGALTLGSGVPHLLNALPVLGERGMPPWRSVLLTTSALSVAAAALVVFFVEIGPFLGRSAPFNWRYVARTFAHRPTRQANFGYLGHMWELYAMWVWVPVLLLECYEEAGWSLQSARLAGFGVLAAGSVGCVLAGVLADRLGRTTVASWSLLVSGGCALVAGTLIGSPGWLTVTCLVWGFAVVADSAQFSAAVSELSDPRYVGTALAVQTSLGFLLTMLTIHMIPPLTEIVGRERVFMFLAIGPAFGIWSMLSLRRSPEAERMASGNR